MTEITHVKEETWAALVRFRLEGLTGDELIKRMVEYARCYMIIRGAEGSELKRLEAVKDFVLSRRSDIEKDMENFGMLQPVLDHFLEEAEGQ